MRKTYMSAVQTRQHLGLSPGRVIITVFDDAVPVQCTAEWLDPAITNGGLIIQISDVCQPRDNKGSFPMDRVLMALPAIRNHIIRKIGAGDIRSEQIEWCFDATTAQYLDTAYRLNNNSDGRLQDEELAYMLTPIYRDTGLTPGSFSIMEMAKLNLS